MSKPRIKIINHVGARDSYRDDVQFTVVTRGDEGNHLVKLIEHIGKTASVGHSFSVVVDPGDSEHEKSFSFDGDGAFRLLSLK